MFGGLNIFTLFDSDDISGATIIILRIDKDDYL